MERLLDHPAIRRTERTGYPRGYDPRTFTTCDWCGGDICVGNAYYEIHGEILCRECVEDCLREAEVD